MTTRARFGTGSLLLAFLTSCGGNASSGAGGATASSSATGTPTSSSHTVVAATVTASSSGTGGMPAGVDISNGSPGVGQSETSVASAPGGIVAAAWINDDVPSIGYAFSTDDGQTWTAPTVASPTDALAYGDPTLVTGGDGSIYLAYTGFDLGFTMGKVYVQRAAPMATTFDAPVLVTPATDVGPFDKPVIAITKNNALLVSYTDYTQGTMVVARSPNGTAWTHTPAAANEPSATYATACPDPGGGRVWLVYFTPTYVGLTWSDDDGLSFPTANRTVVSDATEIDIAAEDPVCVGKGQDVWIAYGRSHDMVNTTSFNVKDYTIRLAHSSDGGATIAARIDAGDSKAAPYFMEPALVEDDAGALELAYYAGQSDADPTSSWRYARSTDGGQTFATSVTIASPLILGDARNAPTWIGDYSGLTVRGTHLYTTFADNLSGNAKVSFANITLP